MDTLDRAVTVVLIIFTFVIAALLFTVCMRQHTHDDTGKAVWVEEN